MCSAKAINKWTEGTLEDLCSLKTESVKAAESGCSRYIGLEHLNSGRFFLRESADPTSFKSSSHKFRKGDILYSKLRPYLDKAVWAPHEGVSSTELLILRPKDPYDISFILSVLHSQQFIDYAQSSADKQYPRTSWNWISKFPINLPPAKERRALGTILWKIQQAIEVETDLVRISRELKAAVMKKLFTEGLNGEPQKETEVGLVPESWQIHKLGESCEVENSSISYTDFQALPAETAETPAVQAMGVKVSDMNLSGNEKYFNSANLVRSIPLALAGKKLVPSMTIVFPKRGAAIATNKKRLTTTWTVLDPNLIGVRPLGSLDSGFLFYWFENFDLKTITEPGPTPQLNKKNLVPLNIAAPADLSNQKAIANIIDTIDEDITAHNSKLSCLSELFSTTLSSLMSASIRVTDLDIDTTCLEAQGAAA